MTSAFRKNSIVVASCLQRIAAMEKHARKDRDISINGKRMTVPEIVAVFQRSLDARAAVDRLEAALAAARKERDAAELERREFDRALGQWAIHRFGSKSAAYLDFGYTPPKTGEKSLETKVLAAKKAQATRIARGTLGKKAKLRIKGSV